MSILSEYSILNRLPNELKQKIKYFQTSSVPQISEKDGHFVTEQGEFYRIHQDKNNKLVYPKIDELSGKNVCQIIYTRTDLLVKTIDGKVFGLDIIKSDETGEDRLTTMVRHFDIFGGNQIVDIFTTDISHYALDTMARLYMFNRTMECRQVEVNGVDRFKYITGSPTLTLAISVDDRVYVVGYSYLSDQFVNEHGELLLVKDYKVKKIVVTSLNIFVLTEQGHILYTVGIVHSQQLKAIECNIGFTDMFVDNQQLICQTSEGVFAYQFHKGLKRTKHINFFEYYLQEYESTPQTIRLTDDGYIETMAIRANEMQGDANCLLAKWEKVYCKQGYLHSEFNLVQTKMIGSGGFGQVFKVARKSDPDRVYALKMINIERYNDKNLVLREVRHMECFDTVFTCELKDAWIESHSRFAFAHILMEYCPMTLRQVIDRKNKVLTGMSQVDRFVTIEILIEVAECLDHVHYFEKQFLLPYDMTDMKEGPGKESKPMIHRDVKPENILLTEERSDGRFVKLCDFGLIKVNDPAIQHSVAGTDQYMAPEIKAGMAYNHLADIYSFGLIAKEMLGNELLNTHTELKNLIKETMEIDPNKRPEAKIIVEALKKSKINVDLEVCLDVQDEYLLNFIMVKSSKQSDEIEQGVVESTSAKRTGYLGDILRNLGGDDRKFKLIVDSLENNLDIDELKNYVDNNESRLEGDNNLAKYFQAVLRPQFLEAYEYKIQPVFDKLSSFFGFLTYVDTRNSDENTVLGLINEQAFYDTLSANQSTLLKMNVLKLFILFDKILKYTKLEINPLEAPRVQSLPQTDQARNFIITNSFQGFTAIFEAIAHAMNVPELSGLIQFCALLVYVKYQDCFKKYSELLDDIHDSYQANIFRLVANKKLYKYNHQSFESVYDKVVKCSSIILAIQLVIERKILICHDEDLVSFTEYCVNEFDQGNTKVEPIYLYHNCDKYHTLEKIKHGVAIVPIMTKPCVEHLMIFDQLTKQEPSNIQLFNNALSTLFGNNHDMNSENVNYVDEDVD